MIIYGSKTCYKCKLLKDKLTKEGESFEYIDIDTLSPDQIDKLIEEHGNALPIIIN